MKKLTLSFDNGPDPHCTPEVLDVLGQRGVKATFFVCGQGSSLHPELKADRQEGRRILMRARDDGHWIGNHTLTHTVELGTTKDPHVIEREIGGNQEILGDLNDQRLFRPYMGGGIFSKRIFSPESIQYLCSNCYTVVMFNCLPRDWEIPEDWPEEALKLMTGQDWALLVVHDVERYGGMKQLARFLDRAISEGVEIVQEFPSHCVPIRSGELVGSLEGMVCGEQPEPARRLASS